MNQYTLGTASDVFHNQWIYWLVSSVGLQTKLNNTPYQDLIHGYSIEVLNPLDPTRVMTIQLKSSGESSEVFHRRYKFGQRLNYTDDVSNKMDRLGFNVEFLEVLNKLKKNLEMKKQYELILYSCTDTHLEFIGLLYNGDSITISFKNNTSPFLLF